MARVVGAGFVLVLFGAGPARAELDFPDLVPGVPLEEADLALYDGKGVANSFVTGSAFGEGEPALPSPRRADANVGSTAAAGLDREPRMPVSSVEGRLGAASYEGAGEPRVRPSQGQPAARDVQRMAAERMQAAVMRGHAAEERTHWTIWY